MGNVKGALEGMGFDLEELIDEENDPDLGIRYDIRYAQAKYC